MPPHRLHPPFPQHFDRRATPPASVALCTSTTEMTPPLNIAERAKVIMAEPIRAVMVFVIAIFVGYYVCMNLFTAL